MTHDFESVNQHSGTNQLWGQVFFSETFCAVVIWMKQNIYEVLFYDLKKLQVTHFFNRTTALIVQPFAISKFGLYQWSSIGGPRAASGPLASCLWPPNCYSFTLCFGWVGTCIPGLVSMPTIHRQLLKVQLLTLTSEQFAYLRFASCKGLKMACSK